MSTIASILTRPRLRPFYLAVPFTAVITGWFNLSGILPAPLAVLAGAAWGIILGLIATWANTKPRLGAWLEDGSVYLGVIAFAFAGCGGLMAIIMLNGALDASSLTGEALAGLFWPSIPYYIVVNSALELLIIPAMLYLGWRAGHRRTLIVVSAVLYFAMRVWTYLTFAPSRMSWAADEHATTTLTAAGRRQAAADLMVDDPRWMLLVAILAILLVAAHLPRSREPKPA